MPRAGFFDRLKQQEQRRIDQLRARPVEYIVLLESLLLDAEDQALTRGDPGLVDCCAVHVTESEDELETRQTLYVSLTCLTVLDNIRARRVRKNTSVTP